MSLISSSSLSLFRLFFAFIIKVQGQTNCEFADTFSRVNLDQEINSKTCAAAGGTVDLSTCRARTTCAVGCSIVTADYAVTSCTDGCTYTSGAHTVSRNFTSGYSKATAYTVLGYSHTFTAGPEKGKFFIYTYDGDIDGDLRLIPEFGGTCSFSFNGVDCTCKQFYCDTARTTYGNRVDCSNVAGGGVIDFCKGGVTIPPPASSNKTLSTLEILYAVPRAVCTGKEIGGSPVQPTAPVPVKAPTKSPVKAPATPVATPPVPTPIVVTAPSPVVVTAPMSQPVIVVAPSSADAPMVGTVPVVKAPTGPVPTTPVATTQPMPVFTPVFRPPNASGPSPPSPGSSPSTFQEYGKCGLFKLSLFCLNGCGLIRRVLGLCD